MKKLFRQSAIVSALIAVALILFGCSNPLSSLGGNKAGYTVTISEAFTCGPKDDRYLVLNLDILNTSKKNDIDVYSMIYNTQVSVDGVVLADGYLSYNNPWAITNPSIIGTGNQGTVQLVYEITNVNLTSNPNITISEYKKKGKVVTFTEDIELSSIIDKKSVSEYAMSIVDTEISDDGEGNDILAITVNFKNNSNSDTGITSALDFKVFQNDKELSTAYLPYKHPWSDDDDFDKKYADAAPGGEITARFFYTLNDSSADIKVSAVDWMSFDKVAVLDETLKIADIARVEIHSDYTFKYKTAVIGMDRWGDEFIVMLVGEFTNNSDETTSFNKVTNCTAMQDGFTLHNAYLSGSSDFTNREIKPGESTLIYVGWKIMTTGSVELSITDRTHYAEEVLYENTFTIPELVANTKSFGDEDNMLDKEVDDEGEIDL